VVDLGEVRWAELRALGMGVRGREIVALDRRDRELQIALDLELADRVRNARRRAPEDRACHVCRHGAGRRRDVLDGGHPLEALHPRARGRRDLDDERSGVEIGDESAQAVSFRVNEAHRVVRLAAGSDIDQSSLRFRRTGVGLDT